MLQKNTAKIHTVTVVVNARPPFGPDDVIVMPEPIKVHHHSMIVFSFDPPTAPGVTFAGIDVETGADQLGQPVISDDGREMTVEDYHTGDKRKVIDFKLKFNDGQGGTFVHDPQIINEPK